MSDVPGLLSLYNFLTRASNVSCSKGASAFLSLPSTEDVRFSLAIDGFIPALQNQNLQIPQRILAAFVLHALYASHDHQNPFHDDLLRIFESERAIAIAASRIKSSLVGPSQHTLASPQDRNGPQAENEQLIWVLWKILRGEGNDLALYSPNILSRMTILEHLRPLHLNVHGSSGHGSGTNFSSRRPPTQVPQPSLGLMGPTTSQSSTTLFQTRNPIASSGLSRTGSAPRILSNRSPTTSELPPVDVTFSASRGIYNQKLSGGQENQTDGSLQQIVPKESFKRHSRYQSSPDPLGVTQGYISSPAFSDPIHNEAQNPTDNMSQLSHNQHSKVTVDQQTLLGSFFEESYTQNNSEAPLGGISGTYVRPDMNQINTSTKLLNESSRVEQQLQHSTPLLPRESTQSNLRHRPVQNYLRNHNITSEDASSFTSVASDTRSSTRSRLDPISRPYPNAVSPHGVLDSPATAPGFEIFSVDGRVLRPDVTIYDRELPQESLMRMNNVVQQAPGIPFAQQKRTLTPTRVSPPTRPPGVIGSGRPSASVPKNDTIADHNALRWSQIGIIGNGRPESSLVAKDGSLANRGMDSRREHESMIPFSVLRMKSMKEESEKSGQPETNLGDYNRRRSNGQTDARTSLLEKLTALSIERKAQELPQQVDVASFKSRTQALEKNYLPSQDNAESVPIYSPSMTFQRQAMPFPPSAIAFHPQPVGTAVSADQNTTNAAATVSLLHLGSALPVPTVEHRELHQSSENSQPSPFDISRPKETFETHINEKERDELSHAIFLLLSARERVLTLTEQRMLQPHLSTLTQPLSLLRPGDIPPLVAKNTDIAAKLLLFLLDRKDEDAERIERVLKDASKNGLLNTNYGPLDAALPLPAAASIDSMAAVDAIQAMVKFVNTCGTPSNLVGSNDVSPFGGREAKKGYLDAIRKLPPTMQSFNLVAKLLRPTRHEGATSERDDSSETRVATLMKAEVLGGFVSGCVRWIEHAEQEEKEGEVHDDRVAIAIGSLCRFYSSLLKHGFVSAASEADTTEIMSFALQFSRFEEARSLYSTLAAARS